MHFLVFLPFFAKITKSAIFAYFRHFIKMAKNPKKWSFLALFYPPPFQKGGGTPKVKKGP